MMQTQVEFETDIFPAYDGEEDQINPGRFGKRLAEFLERGLREQGFQTGQPIAEDWGWLVPVQNRPFRLWIGCGNVDGSTDRFMCFIEPHTPTIRRYFFQKVRTVETIDQLRDAMDTLLSAEPGIREKSWSS